MRTRSRRRLGLALALVALAARSPLPAQTPAKPPPRPNFVFVQAEGQGWASISVPMGDGADAPRGLAGLTPNLERLAARGLVFTQFLATSPRCTPSRASYLTGQGPARLHMTFVNEGGTARRPDTGEELAGGRLVPPSPRTELPTEVRTVADLLRAHGYATAHFGKWHCGRSDPTRHGFDLSDGPNTNQGPGRDRTPNPEQGEAITAAGIAFVEAQAKAGKPFYLQLDHYGGGTEAESRPETRQRLAAQLRGLRGKQGYEAAILADVDRNLGTLLLRLDQLGLAGSTYVIFATDHGAPGRNDPLRGGKGSLLDGGVRVPFVVRGPGVRPGFTAVRAVGFDLLPTVAELAGVQELPPDLDGGSLAAVLRGEPDAAVRRPRPEVVLHFPHYDHGNGGPQSAIWLGDFKLLRSYETGTDQLFDLSRDPREQQDLAARQPAKAKELGKLLQEHLTAVGAQMATPRPPGK